MDTKYEAIFIIKNYEDEKSLKDVMERINNIIVTGYGAIYHKDKIGVKKLAYEVKGNKQGYYYLINFKISELNIKDAIGRISMNINTLENVIKHIIIKID